MTREELQLQEAKLKKDFMASLAGPAAIKLGLVKPNIKLDGEVRITIREKSKVDTPPEFFPSLTYRDRLWEAVGSTVQAELEKLKKEVFILNPPF